MTPYRTRRRRRRQTTKTSPLATTKTSPAVTTTTPIEREVFDFRDNGDSSPSPSTSSQSHDIMPRLKKRRRCGAKSDSLTISPPGVTTTVSETDRNDDFTAAAAIMGNSRITPRAATVEATRPFTKNRNQPLRTTLTSSIMMITNTLIKSRPHYSSSSKSNNDDNNDHQYHRPRKQMTYGRRKHTRTALKRICEGTGNHPVTLLHQREMLSLRGCRRNVMWSHLGRRVGEGTSWHALMLENRRGEEEGRR
eukprot:CAMPEP_0172524408 /NCGR_PEP_ID=MMETSP1066-20121228/294173_1 /TAXON_ID=671091 /ORGANISM="Coscinodiscus wailesii, Strain CCMP2513" /LENGTH=249 /DNA_ID=CAMNT_0013307535 /DNA_START=128 /DNA_END=874 /DNA_ORIENTATION=-